MKLPPQIKLHKLIKLHWGASPLSPWREGGGNGIMVRIFTQPRRTPLIQRDNRA
jgi:hypothetical protein